MAEGLGANKEDLSAVVSSAVNVKSAGDIVTATAQAATGDASTGPPLACHPFYATFKQNKNRVQTVFSRVAVFQPVSAKALKVTFFTYTTL